MARRGFSLALHGGAGCAPGQDYTQELAHMRQLVVQARQRLSDGGCALSVAIETVVALEASGLYIAGRGASPNAAGDYELDACLMDGVTGRAGAVAALQGFESPILVARAVMAQTPHVLLAGDGARRFAQSQGCQPIGDPATWFTHAGGRETNRLPAVASGTVGCAVCDGEGQLAAATSTGGVFGKTPGRVGDSPIIGAGAWADDQVAVSCTGLGEYFLRTATAVQVAHRMRFGGEDLQAAAEAAIDSVADLGGDGGLIAVDRNGAVAMPFRSKGLKRAALLPDGRIVAQAF